jgi:uncharacterized membrane protein
MTGSFWHLTLASFLFVGRHFLLLSTSVRARLVAIFRLKPFLALYSVISIALFAWMLLAYGDAPAVKLWDPLLGFKHLSLTLMLFACLFVVGGYMTRNPAALDIDGKSSNYYPKGVLKITRHPILWGISFWGISHIFANGEVAKLILFGSLTILALGGARHIDIRRRQEMGDIWRGYEDKTSYFPLQAIILGKIRVEKGEIPWWQTLISIALYAGLMSGHETLFGVSVTLF